MLARHFPSLVNALQDQLQRSIGDGYAIDREIGRGGMATVFLARDQKHRRNVALKVLDPELGAVLGAERFLSEIRVTATLQHPNLLPLFDSGDAGGLLYYVMPFVEGESLRHRLDREKQLPVDEATRIAVAVANALDYAHGHGVIHRDLKPENILIQHGQPVVADFGIALAVSNAGGQRVTQTGLSLGTPQYMSPEQATGDRIIDGRTDIYSLAAMTYEMLTGEPPHTGTSAQAIIAKLMTTEPQRVRTLRPSVPRHIAMAVEHGLAKLPADRFATAKEFAAALLNPGFTTSTGIEEVRVATPTGARRALIALGALSAALLVAAAWGWMRPEKPAPVLRYAMAIDSAESIVTGPRWGRIALSPDGSTLAYVGGPSNSIMLRARDELTAKAVPGTENAGAPTFSPDGRRIAFIQNARRLTIASLDGTPPFALNDSVIGLFGLTWSDDDMIYANGHASMLVRVAARTGAKVEAFAALSRESGEVEQVFPEALPEGNGLLYTMWRSAGATRSSALAVIDPGSRTGRVLIEGVSRARYAPSGHLVYSTTDGNLMAVPFDVSSRKTTGEPILMAQGIPQEPASIDFAVSRSGTLTYIGGPVTVDERVLTWVGRDGKAAVVDSTWREKFIDPAISPDGKSIAVSTAGDPTGTGDIWISRLDANTRFKLSVESRNSRAPVWSRDGRRVLYSTIVGDSFAIVEKPADGSATAVKRLTSRDQITHIAQSPDERWLLYSIQASGGTRVYARQAGDTASQLLFPNEPLARQPAISPDGRWVAYALSSGGVPQVYVSPFPNVATAKWLISPDGGSEPGWSRSGKELYYRKVVSRSLWSAAVSESPTFSFGTPREVLSTAAYHVLSRPAISADDSKFLMVKRLGTASRERLTFVENWTRALERAAKR
jgi:eukaryotic-like serine/threonine-protein kinase